MAQSFFPLASGLLVFAGLAQAQGNPVAASLVQDYHSARDMVLRSAEKMPEENYSFRPAPEVRTFGEIIGHIADDQYNLCGPVRAETQKREYRAIELSLHSKTELLGALKKAFAYCDAAYDSFDDRAAGETVKFSGSDRSKFKMLNWNLWHTWEHYGNLTTYLRIKGLVPPSSEPKKK